MLISPAYAQAAGGAADSGLLQQLMPLVLIFGVFYFLLIRPQQKKQKMHREMLTAIRRGDRVVTGGGILGTVTKVISDGELQVEIADGVKVRVDRGMVQSVVSKSEPIDGGDKPDDKTGGDNDNKGGKGGLKKLLGG